MIMPWGCCCLVESCVARVIAKRRVVYNCVCVEVKKAASKQLRCLTKIGKVVVKFVTRCGDERWRRYTALPFCWSWGLGGRESKVLLAGMLLPSWGPRGAN